MKIVDINEKAVIEKITKDELNLDKTFNCGQTFRWQKHPKGIWYCAVNNQIVTLKQEEHRILTNINIKDKDWLVKYLNLDMDYAKEMSKINLEKDDYLRSAYEAGKGIHILRQDLYEMIITFIISQMNSMRNIRSCVDKICTQYGEQISVEIHELGEITSYTFPEPKILASTTESELRKCKVGFRDRYIIEISEFVYNIGTFLPDLKEADYNTAIKMLKNFNGIGDKVANCICLFALHHIEAFPIDTHIKQIINNYYNGHIDISKYGNIAGIVQQYMFYYKALCKED